MGEHAMTMARRWPVASLTGLHQCMPTHALTFTKHRQPMFNYYTIQIQVYLAHQTMQVLEWAPGLSLDHVSPDHGIPGWISHSLSIPSILLGGWRCTKTFVFPNIDTRWSIYPTDLFSCTFSLHKAAVIQIQCMPLCYLILGPHLYCVFSDWFYPISKQASG